MSMTREFWRAVETIHDVVYVAPDAKERFEQIGLRGFWMGYVASRSAALGTPSPEVVLATFHGFAPARIHRALPHAWRLADRDAILRVRLELAVDQLRRTLDDQDVTEVAAQLTAMVRGADWAGKPLAAAHAALPVPADPLGRLWHATTVWREFRGDCHVAILTAAGLDGAAANRLAQAAGLVPLDQQLIRGWSDAEWDRAGRSLRQRGWLDEDGAITAAGRGARDQLEAATDRVCASGIDLEATGRGVAIESAAVSLAVRVAEDGFADVNPTGVPRPRR